MGKPPELVVVNRPWFVRQWVDGNHAATCRDGRLLKWLMLRDDYAREDLKSLA
jgi:hypothetical protein